MVKKIQNLEKSWQFSKHHFLSNTFNFYLFFVKKSYLLSFPILGGRDSTRAFQFSPFQNPGAVPWAWRRTDQWKSLCLTNIGLTQYHQCGNMIPYYCYLIVDNILELYFHTDLTDGIYIAMHNCWQIPMKAIAQVWWCKKQGTQKRYETSLTV